MSEVLIFQSGHARREELRDAFLMSQIDLVKRKSEFFEIDGANYSRRPMLEMMAKCTDPVPPLLCAQLGVAVGSTYGDAAKLAMRREAQFA